MTAMIQAVTVVRQVRGRQEYQLDTVVDGEVSVSRRMTWADFHRRTGIMLQDFEQGRCKWGRPVEV